MYAEIIILAMLHRRSQHGYDLKKGVELALGGTISLNNKVLYSSLKQFEELGAVAREVVPQEGKPNRHIYHLTERGVELLFSYLTDFSPQDASSDAEFFTRVAFFDYLGTAERQAILQQRMAAIQARVDYLQNLQQLAQAAYPTAYTQHVLAFQLQQTRHEQQWIETLLEELQANSRV